MEQSKPGASPRSMTVDYHPAEEAMSRLPVEVPTDSGRDIDEDLRSLLHRRLRFLCLLIALVTVGGVVLGWWTMGMRSPLRWLGWLRNGISLLFVLLAILVWTRRQLSLTQLRAVELGLVTFLAVRLVLRGCVVFWTPTGQRLLELAAEWEEPLRSTRLADASNFICYTAAIYIVAYGVCIPNTWRRCVLVVALFWIIAVVLFAIGVLVNDLTNWSINPEQANAFLLLTAAAALAVYGSHRIETLRRAEVQARRLGQYVLKQRLGGGGMGEVFLADHLLLRRPCAVKLIRPERAGDLNNLRRFEREVRATATLTHPNTVQVYDYGHTRDGTFYYVMEYLPGVTLEELVEREGPLSPARAIHFLRQVCGALTEAHDRGLIHRDIKPGNVMVCERGGIPDVAKLLDFGLVLPPVSESDGEKLTQDGTITGTPAYLSPEQADGRDKVDARSDIYSLGALAYFLLTGQPPFAGRSGVKMLAAHLYEKPEPVSARRPNVPADLEAVVLRCLAKEPEGRFPDVASLDQALAASQMGGAANCDVQAGQAKRCP